MAASRSLLSVGSVFTFARKSLTFSGLVSSGCGGPLLESSSFLIHRSHKGSNRYKRHKVRREQLKVEKDLEKKYGISNRLDFDSKAWMKENFFKEIRAFQERLDIVFRDSKLLVSALAHSSFIDEIKLESQQENEEDADLKNRCQISEQLSTISGEKLSLLGYSSAVNLLKEGLYKRYPNLTSTICSDVIKYLTSRETINMIAKNLAVDELLLLSKEIENIKDIDEEHHLEFTKQDIISDTFFAIIGAIEKDLGQESARSFVNDFILTLIDYEDLTKHVKLEDPHEELMKILSLHGVEGVTRARTIAETGVDTHFPFFHVGIYCNNYLIGDGSGYSARTGRIDAFKNSVFKCVEGDIDFQMLKKSARRL